MIVFTLFELDLILQGIDALFESIDSLFMVLALSQQLVTQSVHLL